MTYKYMSLIQTTFYFASYLFKVFMVVVIQSLSHVQLFATPWTAACQASCPSLFPRVSSNSCSLSWRCHPTILASVVPFSSSLQFFPALRYFPMSWLFSLGGQNTETLASASVLAMNIQGLISFRIELFDLLAALSEVAQSCPTLCNPMNCSLPGSSIHEIFQARILEWAAISFTRRSSWPRDWTQVSRIVRRRFTVWATREDPCCPNDSQ